MGIRVDANDEIVIYVYIPSVANEFYGYYTLLRDGKYIKNRFNYLHPSGVNMKKISFPFLDGDEIIDLFIFPATATVQVGYYGGAVYVVSKGSGVPIPIALLCEGPFDSIHPLCYPDTSLNLDWKKDSAVQSASASTNGASVYSFANSSSYPLRMLGGTIAITTNATVANRSIQLRIANATPTVGWLGQSSVIIPASTSAIVSFGLNENKYQSGTPLDYISIPDFWSQPMSQLQVATLNGVAGDSVTVNWSFQNRIGITSWP